MISEIKNHFDAIAGRYDDYKKKNKYYHEQIKRFYSQIVPAGSNVMEIGCATGDLLNAVKPAHALGIDISRGMLEVARRKYSAFEFLEGDIQNLPPRRDFDYIILSNLLDYVDDLYIFLDALKSWMHDDTKLIINNINPLWAPIIRVGARLWLKTPDAKRNYVTLRDISNLLDILGYDISEKGFRLAFPFYIPGVSIILNKILPRLYGINNIASTQYVICRRRQARSRRAEMSCTVVIPCHNEEGNIAECVARLPSVGKFTEIIIVDDGSSDGTIKAAGGISREDVRVKVVHIEKNMGKGNAVKTGFDAAKGDVLLILDADMSVIPEDVPKFFNTIADGAAEFVNGTRMVYPIEQSAMKFANYVGNKIFGIMTSVIIGQRNTDTLCGTKALLKKHYRHITMKDCRWGDFDILFGAARLKLKTVEMPVHYKRRMSGSSKMKAFKHVWGMIQKCLAMFWELE